MMRLSIRPLRYEDLEAVLVIEKRVFPTAWTRWMFVSEMSVANSFFLAADLDARLVGYTGFYLVADEGHITNMAVDPAYQRRSIATRMMLRLIEVARNHGIHRLTLEVRESNLPALKMYEKFGFEAHGVRKKYYSDTNEDALILSVEDVLATDYEAKIQLIRDSATKG